MGISGEQARARQRLKMRAKSAGLAAVRLPAGTWTVTDRVSGAVLAAGIGADEAGAVIGERTRRQNIADGRMPDLTLAGDDRDGAAGTAGRCGCGRCACREVDDCQLPGGLL